MWGLPLGAPWWLAFGLPLGNGGWAGKRGGLRRVRMMRRRMMRMRMRRVRRRRRSRMRRRRRRRRRRIGNDEEEDDLPELLTSFHSLRIVIILQPSIMMMFFVCARDWSSGYKLIRPRVSQVDFKSR